MSGVQGIPGVGQSQPGGSQVTGGSVPPPQAGKAAPGGAPAGAQPQAAPSEAVPPTQEAVKAELDGLDNFVKRVNENLRFGIHEESERFYVAVIDRETDQVVKQFPPEDVLEVLGKMRSLMGTLFDRQA